MSHSVGYSPAYSSVNRQGLVSPDRLVYRSACVSLGKRIAQRMKELDIGQAELARRVGVSQPTISAIYNGETRRPKDLRRIAIELDTSEAWLLGETDDQSEGALASSDKEALAEKLGLTLVPEMDIGFSMGGGSFLEVFEQKGVRAFDTQWLRTVSEGALGKLFVAYGDGDSMEPTLRDGDVVLIDGGQRVINRPDRIWAVTYGDLGMIKRVRRVPGGSYELMSDNPNVRAIPCSDGEMHVVGRVIWIGRRV